MPLNGTTILAVFCLKPAAEGTLLCQLTTASNWLDTTLVPPIHTGWSATHGPQTGGRTVIFYFNILSTPAVWLMVLLRLSSPTVYSPTLPECKYFWWFSMFPIAISFIILHKYILVAIPSEYLRPRWWGHFRYYHQFWCQFHIYCLNIVIFLN